MSEKKILSVETVAFGQRVQAQLEQMLSKKHAMPPYLVDKQKEASRKAGAPSVKKAKEITPQEALKQAIESMDAAAIAAAVKSGADPCGEIKIKSGRASGRGIHMHELWSNEFSKRRSEWGENFDVDVCLDALDALDEAGVPIYSDFNSAIWNASDAKARRRLIASDWLDNLEADDPSEVKVLERFLLKWQRGDDALEAGDWLDLAVERSIDYSSLVLQWLPTLSKAGASVKGAHWDKLCKAIDDGDFYLYDASDVDPLLTAIDCTKRTLTKKQMDILTRVALEVDSLPLLASLAKTGSGLPMHLDQVNVVIDRTESQTDGVPLLFAAVSNRRSIKNGQIKNRDCFYALLQMPEMRSYAAAHPAPATMSNCDAAELIEFAENVPELMAPDRHGNTAPRFMSLRSLTESQQFDACKKLLMSKSTAPLMTQVNQFGKSPFQYLKANASEKKASALDAFFAKWEASQIRSSGVKRASAKKPKARRL